MISAKHYRQILAGSSFIACLLVQASTVQAQPQSADVNLQQSAEAKAEKWRKFVAPDGAFSILFPGTPTISEQVVDSPGLRYTMHKYELQTFAQYGVIHAEYPKAVVDATNPELLLDHGAKGAVTAVNAELLSIKKISLGGYPGRLMKERMPNGSVIHVKLILAGQRMYQVAITTPKEDGLNSETVDFYNSIATKFLDSFEIPLVKQDSAYAAGPCPSDVANCVPVTEEVLKGKAKHLPQPAYPSIARAAGAQGTVKVRVLVDEEGHVVQAVALSGHPLLQAVSVEAARKARFTPTLVDNKPVKVTATILYHFRQL